MSRLLQITEEDMAELESTLPQLLEAHQSANAHANMQMHNCQKTQWRRVIEIVKNVRWNYGPWAECHVYNDSDESGATE